MIKRLEVTVKDFYITDEGLLKVKLKMKLSKKEKLTAYFTPQFY